MNSSMYKLPVHTKYFFDQFVNAANKRILHPFDWKRFYDFIYAAHRWRTKLSDVQLETLLEDAGFDLQEAKCLATIYYHGRRLLKRKPDLNFILLRAGVIK